MNDEEQWITFCVLWFFVEECEAKSELKYFCQEIIVKLFLGVPRSEKAEVSGSLRPFPPVPVDTLLSFSSTLKFHASLSVSGGRRPTLSYADLEVAKQSLTSRVSKPLLNVMLSDSFSYSSPFEVEKARERCPACVGLHNQYFLQ